MTSNGTAAQPATDTQFYRMADVSRVTGVKTSVLRYWESEFPMLEPVKSPSGHRLYRQQDVDLVLKIKRLLYDEGFTIAGARRFLREPSDAENGNGDAEDRFEGESHHAKENGGATESATELLSRKMLLDLRDTLRAFLTLLERR
jgi:DNA-binding transcriptional MerR regulator